MRGQASGVSKAATHEHEKGQKPLALKKALVQNSGPKVLYTLQK